MDMKSSKRPDWQSVKYVQIYWTIQKRAGPTQYTGWIQWVLLWQIRNTLDQIFIRRAQILVNMGNIFGNTLRFIVDLYGI